MKDNYRLNPQKQVMIPSSHSLAKTKFLKHKETKNISLFLPVVHYKLLKEWQNM